MFYAVSDGHGLPHDPFKAIVTPRPIGWITAMSAKGEINLSPYSFFNAVSDQPHMVAFSSSRPQGRRHLHRGDGRVRLQSRDVRSAREDERHVRGAGARRQRDELMRS